MNQVRRWQRISILALLSVSVIAPVIFVSNRLKVFTSIGNLPCAYPYMSFKYIWMYPCYVRDKVSLSDGRDLWVINMEVYLRTFYCMLVIWIGILIFNNRIFTMLLSLLTLLCAHAVVLHFNYYDYYYYPFDVSHWLILFLCICDCVLAERREFVEELPTTVWI